MPEHQILEPKKSRFAAPENLGDGSQRLLLTRKTSEYLLKGTRKSTDNIPSKSEVQGAEKKDNDKTKLNCWLATGICGNNITSSCLYVIALCAVPAGKYAPIALSFIAGLLYLFRGIYTEVVEALPVNGGTYNLLLNTTTKSKASIAACLTMLSYVTTAVISSTSGMSYIQTMFPNPEDFNLMLWTIVCLSVAAILNLMGIGESAIVSLLIFIFHMISVALLIVLGFVKAFSDMPLHPVPGTGTNSSVASLPMLLYNWRHTSPPDGIILGTYFGYANALLGISGFESSSNYVEQQGKGVFPKTLRNMWIAVTLINPLTALLAQCLMPVDAIAAEAESGALLSKIAELSSGQWLKTIIVIDGALVLIGAVIVAFVGFNGLAHRMTLDRCLPQFLLQVNPIRGTRHWIICGFWFLTSLLVLFTQGNVDVMAGIYTMAFLTVMILFTIGNMLIKLRRSTLPTPLRVPYVVVIIAFFMMTMGLIGNLLSRDVKSLLGFIYFGACFFIPVQVMLNRVFLMRVLAASVRPCISRKQNPGLCMKVFQRFCKKCIKRNIYEPVVKKMKDLEDKPLVFFTSNDKPPVLLEALRYCLANESRRWVKFVRVYPPLTDIPKKTPEIYLSLERLFPDILIDYTVIQGKFSPAMVKRISFDLKVPSNFMFMSSFGEKMEFSFMELGGLRLITTNSRQKDIKIDESRNSCNGTGNGNKNSCNGTGNGNKNSSNGTDKQNGHHDKEKV